MYDLKLREAIDNLSNEDVNVRKKAINSLIGVTDKKVINPLVEATTDDSVCFLMKDTIKIKQKK